VPGSAAVLGRCGAKEGMRGAPGDGRGPRACIDAAMRSCKNITIRTTIDLPDETFRQLKSEAALRGTKLKDLIAEFVEDGLAAGAAAVPVRRSRSPLPVVRSATGTPHPALSNAELEDMLAHGDRQWPSVIFPT